MRYSEIIGGCVTATLSAVTVGGHSYLNNTPVLSTEVLLTMLEIAIPCTIAGAIAGKHALKLMASCVKRRFDQQAQKIENKNPYSYLNPMRLIQAAKNKTSADFTRHTGAALRNSIDRIDRGDIPNSGLSGIIAHCSTYSISSSLQGNEHDIGHCIDEVLQKSCFPGFIRHRIVKRAEAFVRDEVVATIGAEMLLPKGLK